MSWKRECRQGRAGGEARLDKAARPLSTRIIPQPAKTATPRHGKIEGNTWRKVARASVHQLRRPPAWCVDASDLEAAEAAGAVTIEIEDVESGVIWSAPLSEFRTHGLKISRGFGDQVALPLRYWRHSGEGESEAEAQQLTLWAEVAP